MYISFICFLCFHLIFICQNRRQESMYEMTGLYSEQQDQDDSSADIPQDTESESLPSTITVNTINYEPISSTSSATNCTQSNQTVTSPMGAASALTNSSSCTDTVIKCHSRQPSSSLVDREKPLANMIHNHDEDDDDFSRDCGILSLRPKRIQKYARIKVRRSFY